MRMRELFREDVLAVGYEPADKWDAIQGLVELLVRSGDLPAERAGKVSEAVVARERSTSTGMEHGVAIPHAAIEGLDGVRAAMGIVQRPAGLAFECSDGAPARFVVLLLIPREQKLLHIRTLADVARTLGRGEVRAALLRAKGAREAFEVLRAADAAADAP